MPGKITQCCLYGIWLTWLSAIVCYVIAHDALLIISVTLLAGLCFILLASKFFSGRRTFRMFNFSKSDEKTDSQNTVTKSLPVESRPKMELPPSEGRVVRETVITPGTVLSGSVSSESDIVIDGTVEGDISSQKSVRIDNHGNITGNVVGHKVVVNGYLKGTCRGHSVVIMARGRVEGDIFAHEFSIERGGIFSGSSHYVEAVTDNNTSAQNTLPAPEPASEDNVITPEFIGKETPEEKKIRRNK
jgi:cytoskeletal protein CcmA (bactofilin family)